MQIKIVAVGKLQKQFQELFNEYAKRMKVFSSLTIVEIKESKVDNISLKIKKETEEIISHISKNSEVFLCSLKGEYKSSEKFSEIFSKNSNITFVIGGSNGVDETKFSNKIKFSPMTLPHQLFRVVLMEQIYRGFSIINNMKYHK